MKSDAWWKTNIQSEAWEFCVLIVLNIIIVIFSKYSRIILILCFQLNQTISTVLIVSSNRVESWHLALRAVGSKPLSQILQVGSRTSGRNGASGLSSSGDLNALLNLDLPLRTESVEEMKKRSIMAVFYLIILQMTGKLGLKLIIFLLIFTHFYSFLLTFTHFYSFLLIFTHFYSFSLIFTHFYSFLGNECEL